MKLIKTYLDFETAYGNHPVTGDVLGFGRQTTEEYVRHPLFKVHGLGVKVGSDPTFYVHGQEMLDFLAKHPWYRSMAVAHHAHFDGFVLNELYGVRPAFWGDTLSMGRALFPYASASLDSLSQLLGLGAKGDELSTVKDKWGLTEEEQRVLGGYCCNDVDLTAKLFEVMAQGYPLSELAQIDLTVRMFTEPVIEVDRGVLVREYRRELRALRALLKACGVEKSVLASNDQFAALLLKLGVEPPKKLSAAKVKDGRVSAESAGTAPAGLLPSFSAKGLIAQEVKKAFGAEAAKEKLAYARKMYPWAYAFGKGDEQFKMLCEHPDESVRLIVEARIGAKSTIKATRTKRFFKIGARGAFPVYLNYYGADTGRWSGGDKQNAQNLPRVNKKDPDSGALRKSWVAPPGHLLAVRDLGQVEARMNAYWAGQEDLLDLFRADGDPYNRQASLIYGYEVDRKKDEFQLEGMAGKASVLGCGYGMGWSKFQESLRIGFMGMPSILFTQEQALKLGADVDVFRYGKSYKKDFAYLGDEALAMKPLNVSAEDHLWHCAAVKKIVDGFRQSNWAIKAGWKEAGEALYAILRGEEVTVGKRNMIYTCRQGFRLPNGMAIQYNKLRVDKSRRFHYCKNDQRKEWVDLYGGKAVENIVQALSRIVLSDQMARVNHRLKARAAEVGGGIYKVCSSTHDEIIVCVPAAQAEWCLEMMGEEMKVAPDWCHDLPLKSSGGYAVNYGDCEK